MHFYSMTQTRPLWHIQSSCSFSSFSERRTQQRGVRMLAGIFGFEYLHEKRERYYLFYLLTLSAMLGLCYAGNLLTFYLFYEAMSLLSFPLVLHEQTEASRRAAM